MTYYTIYKVTNEINGKIYIGSHKTKDLNDNYMGSGKYLRRAIEKHGIENFIKEILYVFDTPEQMYAKEAELVNEEFITESNTYNLKVGGFGGFDYINSTGKNLYGLNGKTPNVKNDLARGRKTQKDNRKSEEYLIALKEKQSNAQKQLYKNGYKNPFKDKKHTEEAKQKISEKSSIHQKGERNSQFGTRWITNGCQNKKHRGKNLPDGWTAGRTYPPVLSKVDVCNNCLAKEEAYTWYDKFKASGSRSIRDYVRRSDYPHSHVSFTKMLKKYVTEFQPVHGKRYFPD